MTTTSTDHPFAPMLNAARNVVFSRTLKTADWNNTTIAAGDMTEEVDRRRQGGDGHIVVWGGVRLWRSLMRLGLIDELRLSLFPYVAGEGTRLFDGVPDSYRLDLVSSHRLAKRDRRAAVPAAPLTPVQCDQGAERSCVRAALARTSTKPATVASARCSTTSASRSRISRPPSASTAPS